MNEIVDFTPVDMATKSENAPTTNTFGSGVSPIQYEPVALFVKLQNSIGSTELRWHNFQLGLSHVVNAAQRCQNGEIDI